MRNSRLLLLLRMLPAQDGGSCNVFKRMGVDQLKAELQRVEARLDQQEDFQAQFIAMSYVLQQEDEDAAAAGLKGKAKARRTQERMAEAGYPNLSRKIGQYFKYLFTAHRLIRRREKLRCKIERLEGKPGSYGVLARWFYYRRLTLPQLEDELQRVQEAIAEHPMNAPRAKAAWEVMDRHDHKNTVELRDELEAAGLPSVAELTAITLDHMASYTRLHKDQEVLLRKISAKRR